MVRLRVRRLRVPPPRVRLSAGRARARLRVRPPRVRLNVKPPRIRRREYLPPGVPGAPGDYPETTPMPGPVPQPPAKSVSVPARVPRSGGRGYNFRQCYTLSDGTMICCEGRGDLIQCQTVRVKRPPGGRFEPPVREPRGE